MESREAQPGSDGHLSVLEEESLGQPSKLEGRSSKLNRYTKMQTFILVKDMVTLEEIKLRFMKQGIDVSRSRLLSEAIRVLDKEVTAGKVELKA